MSDIKLFQLYKNKVTELEKAKPFIIKSYDIS